VPGLKRVVALLPSITPQNYDELRELLVEVLTCDPMAAADERSDETIAVIADTMFVNALRDEHRADLYAQLLRDLDTELGKSVSGAVIRQCQAQFEHVRDADGSTPVAPTLVQSDMFAAKQRANVSFLGSLYLASVVTERLVLCVLHDLLYADNRSTAGSLAGSSASDRMPTEHELELFAVLLKKVFCRLTREIQQTYLPGYLRTMRELSDSATPSLAMRSLIAFVENGWAVPARVTPRTSADAIGGVRHCDIAPTESCPNTSATPGSQAYPPSASRSLALAPAPAKNGRTMVPRRLKPSDPEAVGLSQEELDRAVLYECACLPSDDRLTGAASSNAYHNRGRRNRTPPALSVLERAADQVREELLAEEGARGKKKGKPDDRSRTTPSAPARKSTAPPNGTNDSGKAIAGAALSKADVKRAAAAAREAAAKAERHRQQREVTAAVKLGKDADRRRIAEEQAVAMAERKAAAAAAAVTDSHVDVSPCRRLDASDAGSEESASNDGDGAVEFDVNGETLRFSPRDEIAVTGNSSVYRATLGGSACAVKLWRAGKDKGSAKKEFAAQRELRHDNIVNTFACGTTMMGPLKHF
jgi:hypothetical protein